MKNLSQKILLGLVAVLILTLATSPWWSSNNVSAQSIKDRFNGILVDHDATIGGDLSVTGDVDVTGDLGVTGTGTFAEFMILTPQTQVMTAGLPITPTAAYMTLTSAAAVTSSTTVAIVASTAITGQLLIVQNTNASDIIIIDGTGGTVECKADVALASLDTASFLFDGTEWVCLSLYDNS